MSTIAMTIPGPLPNTPAAQSCFSFNYLEVEVPIIDKHEPFHDVVKKVSHYISQAIDSGYNYEQIRTSGAAQRLRPLVTYLSDECHHPAIVAALLTSRWLFTSADFDDSGINESRGLACELVAWEFLACLSGRELMVHLLHDIPEDTKEETREDIESGHAQAERIPNDCRAVNDQTPLLRHRESCSGHHAKAKHGVPLPSDRYKASSNLSQLEAGDDPTKPLAGLNALEIAAVASAKKFLGQRLVQKVVQDIWDGDIVFWESFSVNAVKKARTYNKRIADPYARLRVPKYAKAIQICFFAALLGLYYAVLIRRHPHAITVTEVWLYIWIAAFAYDEFGEFQDAGVMFYQTDFWSLWDLGIILTGVAFFILRITGLLRNSDYLTDISFDTLSLLSLFLVPRLFSLASLNPYFGSLIPVLKEMTKAIVKFLPVVVILYLGFLSTFWILARERMSLNEMSWILIKVQVLQTTERLTMVWTLGLTVCRFFGASYLGFDTAAEVHHTFPFIGALANLLPSDDYPSNQCLTRSLTAGGPGLFVPRSATSIEEVEGNLVGDQLANYGWNRLIFVLLTNILLITSLISLLSNSVTEVMAHAREEYLFQYSIYVLESSSTSTRLTYFFPPLNLIALLFRPLRLVLPAQTQRRFRILILKITHAPLVAIIFAYEASRIFSSPASHSPPISTPPANINYASQGLLLSDDLGSLGGRFTALKPPLAPSTPHQSHQTLPGSSGAALSMADAAKMLTLMQKLSAQVDELTMRLAKQSEEQSNPLSANQDRRSSESKGR